MKQKSTGDLTGELTSTASFDAYLRANEPFFSEQGVAELARRSGISEVYLHQVFAGRRIPSRDRLLCICIGLSLTLEETQRMLTQGSYALLYPRTKRDAIISYGLVHQLPLQEINDKLFAEQEKSLF